MTDLFLISKITDENDLADLTSDMISDYNTAFIFRLQKLILRVTLSVRGYYY
jgi:hypothetical protein